MKDNQKTVLLTLAILAIIFTFNIITGMLAAKAESHLKTILLTQQDQIRPFYLSTRNEIRDNNWQKYLKKLPKIQAPKLDLTQLKFS